MEALFGGSSHWSDGSHPWSESVFKDMMPREMAASEKPSWWMHLLHLPVGGSVGGGVGCKRRRGGTLGRSVDIYLDSGEEHR